MSDWATSWFVPLKPKPARTNKEVILTLRETLLLLDKKEGRLESRIALETKKAQTNVILNKKGGCGGECHWFRT